jgi:uncharacterized protein YdiU (UPF0061 family)
MSTPAVSLATAPAEQADPPAPRVDLGIRFDNTYARLPDRFYVRMPPVPVAAPALVAVNAPLAERMGIDPARLSGPEGVAALAGNALPEGAEPIAQAYAGHQFGGFSPRLGDGRAILLGEVVAPDGARFDLQLKGSGRTPFSRGGDGRAAIGPMLREYIISEAMQALGIPTTRSLAVVTTGEPVYRETALSGAVLTRIAASHLRVGTFQYFAARGDAEAVRILTDYAIARHYPDLAGAERPALALLDAVSARQAELVARWIAVGFVHGVMNTDNTAISGETIDYGPCAFLDEYDPAKVFSSIDHQGRYAYANQPRILQWNLARLAEALLPLLAEDQDKAVEAAQEVLSRFAARFEAAHRAGMLRKIGLAGAEREGDAALLQDLLRAMAEAGADFTLTFRRLCAAAEGEGEGGDAALRALFADPAGYDAWAPRWRARLAEEGRAPAEIVAAMRAVNPAFIPRNHLVEEALAAATERADYAPFEALVAVISRPFEEQPGRERYAEPPEPAQRVTQTFCGT